MSVGWLVFSSAEVRREVLNIYLKRNFDRLTHLIELCRNIWREILWVATETATNLTNEHLYLKLLLYNYLLKEIKVCPLQILIQTCAVHKSEPESIPIKGRRGALESLPGREYKIISMRCLLFINLEINQPSFGPFSSAEGMIKEQV